MNKIKKGFYLINYLGISWAMFRVILFLKKRFNVIQKKMPQSNWQDCEYDFHENTFGRFFPFFNWKPKLLEKFGKDSIEKADNILKGSFIYYSKHVITTGLFPNWHKNYFTGEVAPNNIHWSKINTFNYGDVKNIWELSRFSFVYDLVRAYGRTNDQTYVKVFWRLLDDWQINNPPNTGINWQCGQEVALRLMAWCFGLFNFFKAKETTKKRVDRLLQMIEFSAERIDRNIGYALSQNNNHGISEAMGLWTVGVLFPFFKKAKYWERRGKKFLEKQAKKLIYSDGSFSQHSVNYHRVMLHDYLWVLRLAELNDRSFSNILNERVGKSFKWLYGLMDYTTGRLPNYGANDGALVLPLTDCDYQDFRPTVQLGYYYFNRRRCFCDGPWNEALLWLYGEDVLKTPFAKLEIKDYTASIGGYYNFRSENGMLFIRCPTKFKHRPPHADLLHIDLWWKGINFLKDSGTYSYNASAPWNNPFVGSNSHNVVVVDGKDQMEQVGKFLMLPWISCKVNHFVQSQKSDLLYFEAEHNGYGRLKDSVKHKRAIIRLPNENWLTLDWLTAKRSHEYKLNYICADLPYSFDNHCLHLNTDYGNYYLAMGLVQGDPIKINYGERETFSSSYYQQKEKSLNVTATCQQDKALFYTLLGPDPLALVIDGDKISVKLNDLLIARITMRNDGKIISIKSDADILSIGD